MKKRILSLILAVIIIFSLGVIPASAKTITSARADNIFFYALNSEGMSVLLKVMPLSDVKKLAHGDKGGQNYCISTTDNYPTTQYCEARGFTVTELIDYVKSVSSVSGVSGVSFSGGDTLRLMATDSYGSYSRSWTYNELYGVKRYFFEGLYDAQKGWKTAWEVAGEDSSKFGVSLEEYNAKYKDSDPYYADKRAVFDGGVETTVILATESYSGRTTSETLIASTEPGIASYIKANGGKVAGCLKDAISDEYALRLSLPMTEADLMAAHRTAYDNFKWIYNMRLDMVNAPSLKSLGTVAEPVPAFSVSGNTLTVTFACATPGASIYYGDDGAPQTPYTKPVTIDISGRDLESDPVTLYATAVKEGCDDAGVLTYKYPGMAPAFKTVYSGMTGQALTFEAAEGVSSADWNAWTGAMTFISMKSPSITGYATLDKAKYSINNTAKTVTFDKSLFTGSGSYSFIFHANKYANKNVSVTFKKAAPGIKTERSYPCGKAVTVTFDDTAYGSGLSVYVTPEGGRRTMISTSYLDRSEAGKLTIKQDYFSLSSAVMKEAGVYTLELVNNSYSPASQTVKIVLTSGFTDVLPGTWYYEYVTDLVAAGIVNGMTPTTFEPDGTLTWGQALKLLLLTAGYDEQAPTADHWAGGYKAKAVEEGFIDNSVDLNAPISRLAFCRVTAKIIKAAATLDKSPFTDTSDPAVIALYEKGIINGMGEGIFSPDTTLNRAQISKIIWCIRKLEG